MSAEDFYRVVVADTGPAPTHSASAPLARDVAEAVYGKVAGAYADDVRAGKAGVGLYSEADYQTLWGQS